MKKALVSVLAIAAFGLVSVPAAAEVMLDWKINEAVVDGPGGPLATACAAASAGACIRTVDNMTGKYNELLGFDGSGGFAATAVGFFGGYLSNEGSINVGSFLTSSPADGLSDPRNYRIYAKFAATGSIVGGAAVSDNGSLELWLDRDANTLFDNAGLGGFANPLALATAASGAGDDMMIGFSNISYGASSINFGQAGASFNIYFEEFALTAFGATYWFDPSPFHVKVWSNGDLDTPFNPLTEGTASVVGDMSAVFVVPEPGSLALVGLAMAGLGFSQRRRKVQR